MKLEVISRRPRGAARPVPLLFVHGAFAAAWIWDVHFLPYFAERGYAAYALSLRGHGASEGAERLAAASLDDYAADLASVVADLPAPPALIGHSMGGGVVQAHIHNHRVPAAVLMASAPPHGMVGSTMAMAMRHPAVFRELAKMQSHGPDSADFRVMRRALFSDDLPDELAHRYLARTRGESGRIAWDLLGFGMPRWRGRPDLPVLVMGVGNDVFVPVHAVRMTADSFGTEAVMFDGMAHAMMLETRWREVADCIADFLDDALAAGHAA